MTIKLSTRSAFARAMTAATVMAVLAGCASPRHKAPIEDRGARAAPVAATAPESSKALPGAENTGKPGYYAVKPGDTLIRIGLESGQNWRDIARWNNIENPNLLEVGQVLRVVTPAVDASATTARAVPPTRVEVRPLDGTKPAPAPAAAAAVAVAVAPLPPIASAAAATSARDSDDDVNWGWPSTSTVAMPFDEARSKGLVFAGKAGEAVLAAADGRVIYAGSGLRGYGNLVIVKHNNTYLTAYAHNQALLVKEDQVVRRGQRIAEMGSSDAERVQLHFELRKLGKPVDPARVLPAR